MLLFTAALTGTAGLSGLKETIVANWLGPVFLMGVAAFAILFIKDRAWTKLIGFVGIAAVVGVLVYGGESLFGPGGVTEPVVDDTVRQIQTGQ